MKDQIQKLLKNVLENVGAADIVPEVEIPENADYGEYTTNVAMRLTKVLKKPLMDIALQVKNMLLVRGSQLTANGQDQSSAQSNQMSAGYKKEFNVLQVIESIDVVKPGFINFKISEAKLITQIDEVLSQKEGYGTAETAYGIWPMESQKQNVEPYAVGHKPFTPHKMRIIVEFTDPNPFKELHVGHLYSNAVGESLSRLFEAAGCEVKRADYYGDVGMHAAKSIWGLKRKLADDHKTLDDIAGMTPSDRVHYLGQAYVLGNDTYEKDPAAAEEMKDINYLAYVSAQEYMKENSNWQPVVDYRQYIKGKEDQLAQVREYFETGRRWSMEYFETVFRRLGTKFDYYYPESSVAEFGAKTVHDHTPGVFEVSDGATVFRGEKFGLHTRVFINSLGLPTYEAKELGLAQKKYEEFPYDHSYIVTGNEINEYFKVLMTALSQINPQLAAKNTHLGHGMVRLPEGKMSSRTGNVLTAEWLLDLVKSNIAKILDRNETDYDKVTRNDIAEKAMIAAIKYSLLKVGMPSSIAFDVDKSVSFDGDSGPYLLYTYARCKSVLRKASESQSVNASKPDAVKLEALTPDALTLHLNPEEHSLIRLIFLYPDIVGQAVKQLAPNVICLFLFQLAQSFNLFYAKHKINIKSEMRPPAGGENGEVNDKTSQFRVDLTSATAQVLKNGLQLLGISTVERM